jgi:hypothetical protein
MIVNNGKGENSPPDSAILVALLPSICEAALNPVGRLELLGWLLTQLETLVVVLKFEWTELLKALVISMQDRIAATRTLAEQIFCSLMSHGFITRNDVGKSFRDLAPATLRPLQTAVDRILAVQTEVGRTGPGEGNPQPSSPIKREKEMTTSREQIQIAQPKAGAAKSELRGTMKSSSTAAPVSSGDDSRYFPLKKTTKAKRYEELLRYNWPQPPEDPGRPSVLIFSPLPLTQSSNVQATVSFRS